MYKDIYVMIYIKRKRQHHSCETESMKDTRCGVAVSEIVVYRLWHWNIQYKIVSQGVSDVKWWFRDMWLCQCSYCSSGDKSSRSQGGTDHLAIRVDRQDASTEMLSNCMLWYCWVVVMLFSGCCMHWIWLSWLGYSYEQWYQYIDTDSSV